ncbi:MAG: carboxypeptidase-like regulatory domain-containing protein [Acidobacteria bacterium]|nr:carboxypeptidase-like regulatory domain-containing protein [Acidobacteriota bacterium]
MAGTVFRDPGFALAGARITMTAAPTPQKTAKFKKLKAVADSRGEFAFRVPPEPMRYVISVELDGFTSQEKPVVVQAAERVEVYFTLEPVSR